MCVWARGEWANLLLHVQVTLLLRLHQLRLALVFIELSSAPGLGSPLPHLHQDWARPCHICARTGLTSAQLAAQTLPAVTPPFPPAERARADRFRAAPWRERPAAVGEGGLDLQHAVALALLCEDSIQMRHLRAQPLELREQIAVLCARALSVLRRAREAEGRSADPSRCCRGSLGQGTHRSQAAQLRRQLLTVLRLCQSEREGLMSRQAGAIPCRLGYRAVCVGGRGNMPGGITCRVEYCAEWG